MKRRNGSGGVDVASGNIRRVYFVSKKTNLPIKRKHDEQQARYSRSVIVHNNQLQLLHTY